MLKSAIFTGFFVIITNTHCYLLRCKDRKNIPDNQRFLSFLNKVTRTVCKYCPHIVRSAFEKQTGHSLGVRGGGRLFVLTVLRIRPDRPAIERATSIFTGPYISTILTE